MKEYPGLKDFTVELIVDMLKLYVENPGLVEGDEDFIAALRKELARRKPDEN